MIPFLFQIVMNIVYLALCALLIAVYTVDAQGQCSIFRVRKEWRQMDRGEQERFANAVIRLKQSGTFDALSRYHYDNTPPWHGNLHFLPIHRYLVWLFEEELLRIDPSVSVPYWNCTFPILLTVTL